MRSAIPLRLEYREAGTGKLLAVDDNGNGVFTDRGDVVSPREHGSNHSDFPVLQPLKDVQFAEIESWIFTKPDSALDQHQQIKLPLEIHQDGKGWEEYSSDIIRNGSR